MPSSEQKQAVMGAIRQHKSLAAAADAVGISRRTLQLWRQHDTDFAEDVRMALLSAGSPMDEDPMAYPEPHSTDGLPSLEMLHRDKLYPAAQPAPGTEDTPATGFIGDSERRVDSFHDPLPDVGMSLPQPLPTAPEPASLPLAARIHSLRVDMGGPPLQIADSGPLELAPEVVLGEAPRIVHSESPPPLEPPLPLPIPVPTVEPVSLSSPEVMACLHDIVMKIRDDATYARNLRVRLATMQSNDQGPLTKLIDVIRGE